MRLGRATCDGRVQKAREGQMGGLRADSQDGSPAIWHIFFFVFFFFFFFLRVMMQGPSRCWVTGARCIVALDEADPARNLSDRMLHGLAEWREREGERKNRHVWSCQVRPSEESRDMKEDGRREVKRSEHETRMDPTAAASAANMTGTLPPDKAHSW
ncbi:uncharacterized protein IWZ02DRAFT_302937 [Phyllosticta citriasiana]|uniref:uncharacterized protein n=1 Tax=Phyllosticta citriasiana TaxID=595635 RepID=UPI0030FDD7B4